MADQLLLGRQIQPARGCSGSDDHGARLMPFAVDVQAERPLRKIDFDDRAVQIFGAEMLGLLLHVLDEIGAVDAFGKAGKVLDERGNRELAAGLMPADNQRLQIRTRRIDGRSVSGAAGANDHNVSHGIQEGLPPC